MLDVRLLEMPFCRNALALSVYSSLPVCDMIFCQKLTTVYRRSGNHVRPGPRLFALLNAALPSNAPAAAVTVAFPEKRLPIVAAVISVCV